MKLFRTRTLNGTAQLVNAGGSHAKMVNIVNLLNALIYLKFYDTTAAPDPSTDVPILTIQIPSLGTTLIAAGEIVDAEKNLYVRAVTGAADTDNTAPGTLPIIEIGF